MPKRAVRKLNDAFVRSIKPDPEGKDLTFFFRDVPCLGLRVKPSGVKTYFLQYRDGEGRQRKILIGPVWSPKRKDGLSPTKAIDKAAKMRVAVRDGADPAAARDGNRNAKTVDQLCDEHLKAGTNRLKPSTMVLERVRIETHVKPLLGHRAVINLKPADIERFQADVANGKTGRGGRGGAIRTVETLSAILERAVRDGLIPKNPAHKVKWRANKPVKPPFSFAAVSNVGAAMRELEAQGERLVGLQTIRHLLLSGFRRSEALTLKYGHIDAAAHCVRLPDTKTGAQTRPLGQATLDHLASFRPARAKPNDFVFPGPGKGGHYIGARKAWKRVAKRAGISGVTLHGLRHWFASAAAEMNYSELVIAGMLGHSAGTVTARYATTPDSALVAAADRISLALARALDGASADNVVKLSA